MTLVFLLFLYLSGYMALYLLPIVLALLVDILIIAVFVRVKFYDINYVFDDEDLALNTRIKTIGGMIENLIHQWRQPLSVITMASSGMRLKKEMDILDDSYLYDSVNQITTQSQYLSNTIENFKDLFEPKGLKIYFKMNEDFENILALLELDILKHNISLEADIKNITLFDYKVTYNEIFIYLLKFLIEDLSRYENKKRLFIHIYTDSQYLYIKFKNNQKEKSSLNKLFNISSSEELYVSKKLIEDKLLGEIDAFHGSFKHKDKEYTGIQFEVKLRHFIQS